MFKDLTETAITIAVSIALLAITYAAYGSVLTGLVERAFAPLVGN